MQQSNTGLKFNKTFYWGCFLALQNEEASRGNKFKISSVLCFCGRRKIFLSFLLFSLSHIILYTAPHRKKPSQINPTIYLFILITVQVICMFYCTALVRFVSNSSSLLTYFKWALSLVLVNYVEWVFTYFDFQNFQVDRRTWHHILYVMYSFTACGGFFWVHAVGRLNLDEKSVVVVKMFFIGGYISNKFSFTYSYQPNNGD
jgi:hypothetical protein